MGPETSRGRHHPKRFSLGLHPVSLGKTKEMGWNRQHKVKIFRKRIGEFLKPTPGRGVEPRPYKRFSRGRSDIYFAYIRPMMPFDNRRGSSFAAAAAAL